MATASARSGTTKPKSNVPTYDDISLFEQFSEDVERQIAEDSSGGDRDTDVWFLDVNNQTYRLRFYPEITRDEETGKPKLLLTRQVFSHSGFEKVKRRLHCSGSDCPICKETRKLAEAKHNDAWRFKSKRESVARAYFFASTVKKDYKYLKYNEYGFVVLRNKAAVGLNNFLSTLTPDEMRQVLNPKVEAPELVLNVTPGSEGQASWSFGLKKRELPPPPADYRSVNEVYVQEEDTPTEEELKAIRAQVNRMLASMEGSIIEPDDNKETAPARPAKGAAKASVAAALGKKGQQESEEQEDDSQDESGATEECAGADDGLEFGKNPEILEDSMNAICLSCPNEDACKEASAAAKEEVKPVSGPKNGKRK